MRSSWIQSPHSIEIGKKVKLTNHTEYASFVDKGTPRMRAQPMIEPCKMAITSLSKRLADALSKKKIG